MGVFVLKENNFPEEFFSSENLYVSKIFVLPKI